MITSTKNQQIRTVIERIEQVYVSESFLKHPEHSSVLGRLPSFEIVSDSVFSTMSDTKTPQGILALVKKREYTLEEMLAGGQTPFLMLLENLQDPGNLGTIVRAGEGAGITGVIMSRDTVDIYNPKVIRSTMGSLFRIPFLYAENLGETVRFLKKNHVKILAAHLEGAVVYDEEDCTGALGFLIGNEGNGLSEEIGALADARIKIPMAGQVESLNAAVAASVLMFETARQRRKRS